MAYGKENKIGKKVLDAGANCPINAEHEIDWALKYLEKLD